MPRTADPARLLHALERRVRHRAAALAALLLLAAAGTAAATNTAKGSLEYNGRPATVRYAYLVSGPDRTTGKPIRRLLVSASDLGPRIQSCKTMACVNAALGEGISVDLGDAPRFGYWVTLNNQRIQHSGVEDRAALKARIDTSKQLAGTLRFDRVKAGGPKVDVEFDAALARTLRDP